MTQDTLQFAPRIRTLLLADRGNLKIDGRFQHCKINVLMPQRHNDEILPQKIEISSCICKEGDEEYTKDYMSLRLTSLCNEFGFFVGYALAMRESAKYRENPEAGYLKDKMHKLIDHVFAGHYDAQIHAYGFKQKAGRISLNLPNRENKSGESSNSRLNIASLNFEEEKIE